MRSRLLLLVSCFLLIYSFLLGIPMEASAAPKLDVKTSAGFANKGKYGKGLPLSITVKNTGTAFSGDIVIDGIQDYNTGSGISIPLEIGENETKTIEVALEQYSDVRGWSGSNQQMIHFYEGGWKKGKSIDYTGKANVNPQLYEEETTIVLTLTSNADRLLGFTKLGKNNTPNISRMEVIDVAQLVNFTLPSKATSWSMGDVLVIDEYKLADLTEDQQQAIIEWVKNGGKAIIGASANVVAEVGLMKEYLPLTLGDEQTISKETLGALTKGGKFKEDITAYKADLNKNGQVILEANHTPLVAKLAVGEGEIIQTAFSLGNAPLAKEDDYTKLLEQLIPMKATNLSTQGTMNQMNGELIQHNEIFPSFQVSAIFLLVIVILYIFLLGPLLYFLLKNKDKREHAWWIIPVLSIVTSLLIFWYGAKDRLLNPQIQQTAVYKVNEDNSLSGVYASALLSNRSGDFEFTAPKNTSMTMSTYSGYMNLNDVHQKSMFEQFADHQSLTIRNSRYWGVNSMFGQTRINDIGRLDIQLNVEDGAVKGTVKNNFPFALKDVSIWSGVKWLELGDIKPNETLNVTQTINGSILLSPMQIGMTWMEKAKNKKELLKNRQQSARNLAYQLLDGNDQPAIVAWVDEVLLPIELKTQKAERTSLSLIVQNFNPKTNLSGEFVLPANAMAKDINSKMGGYIEQNAEDINSWYLDDGEYDVSWTIPDSILDKKVKWVELQLANTDKQTVTLHLFNVKKDKFEEITDARLIVDKDVSQYISKDGQVIYKLMKDAGNKGEMRTVLPELQLKGEVQK
ncbi:hypothetical protein JFL43_11050 [Viridibacillus sp. YIM B01967]|uniref:DUF7408 domain-containing protein n=1 Tax=Viridibacillus soli TaxID=2798301 RepID=A0ABS1H7J5_9BACL|nr:hypothetical protein [Viridibacillus soli]MBK3495375.1 hypothetical protein [Viridibacillus soli]